MKKDMKELARVVRSEEDDRELERIMEEFSDVLVTDLGETSGTMIGEPMAIKFKTGTDLKPIEMRQSSGCQEERLFQ